MGCITTKSQRDILNKKVNACMVWREKLPIVMCIASNRASECAVRGTSVWLAFQSGNVYTAAPLRVRIKI